MKFLRRYFSRSILVATSLVVILLMFSFLSPVFPLADSISHFRFQLVILLIVLVVLTALLGKRCLVVAGLVVAVSCIFSFVSYSMFSPARVESGKYQVLKLMQLNLLFMNRDLKAVAQLARDRDVDVITLQEVNHHTGRVLSLLQQDYPYQVRCSFQAVGSVAVLSRLPLASTQSRGCLNEDGVAWLRVRVGQQALTISSVHLHWPFPFSQWAQVERLESQLGDLPQPVIMAGDFNAAPWSQAVSRLASASQTEVAPGLYFSFYLNMFGAVLPVGLPIDHVLLPRGFIVDTMALGPKVGSDHYSVFASIAVPVKD
ncbi:MAG: endonuclease/exonuclease/phosphatase family protein [Gammaproteobacteria bacterium]|nr:endonuclease/exonuclease/phosphatase family protein [Gammaproteobacteria bacterium]